MFKKHDLESDYVKRINVLHFFLIIFDCELQVVLPEGSRDISVSAPFPLKQEREVLKKL